MGSTTTAYQYAGDAVLLEKQGSSTTATYSYGNALLRKDGEYPLCDGLGSARAETSSSQAVTFTVNTDAFGNQIASSGSTGSSYQFAATSGYRNDGDAGLLKVGCRYYDPQLGAFTSRDTYLDQMPYLYCEHDPINAVDPSGHQGGGCSKTHMPPNPIYITNHALVWMGYWVALGVAIGTALPTAGGSLQPVIGAVGSVGIGGGLGAVGGDPDPGGPWQKQVPWTADQLKHIRGEKGY